jgi:hypothetical protein
MDKKLERNIIWSLAMILIVLGLTGCVSSASLTLNPKKITTLDTVANMPSIINILGCMFAPQDPSCDKELKDKPISALTDSDY